MRKDITHGFYTVDDDGQFHSFDDAPAIVIESYVQDDEYIEGYKAWYKHGKLHREDGPAVIRNNGEEHYYKDGELWQL